MFGDRFFKVGEAAFPTRTHASPESAISTVAATNTNSTPPTANPSGEPLVSRVVRPEHPAQLRFTTYEARARNLRAPG